MNLATNLRDAAADHPDVVAVSLAGNRWTYAELGDAAGRFASVLRERGVRPGDRVGLMVPNVSEFVVAYYGILHAGAVVLPLNVLLKGREVAYHLGDAGAALLIAWHGFAAEAEAGAASVGAEVLPVEPAAFAATVAAAEPAALVDRDAEDTAVLLYTSGTTGTPKGAELTHSNLQSNATTIRGLHEIAPGTVMLGALPLFHAFGQTCAMNATVIGAGTLALLPRFDPSAAMDIIEQEQVTILQGVPTMFAAMLNDASASSRDLSSLERCVSGGSSMPVEVMKAFEAAFGCVVLEGYGLSETAPTATSNPFGGVRKPGSVGVAIPGVEVRVVGEDGAVVPTGERGEVVIKGPNVMKGYWQRPEATEATLVDGWLHTGDVGTMDEDGYLFIVDRIKDLIIRGGYNVYPREIEEVVYEHPAVREACVLAVPHAELGEEVALAVAFKEGAAIGPEELKAWVKERVAAYKYPRHVWVVDELPKGATGKILRREIDVPAPLPA